MLGDAEAVFALSLVICNVVLFGFISRQIHQTEEANIIANQSLEIASNSFRMEWGEVVVIAMRIDGSMITFTAENIGRGTALLLSAWNMSHLVPITDPAPTITGWEHDLVDGYAPMKSGAIAGTFPAANVQLPAHDTRLTPTQLRSVGVTHSLIFHGALRYQATTGVLRRHVFTARCERAVVSAPAGPGLFVFVAGPGYTFDVTEG